MAAFLPGIDFPQIILGVGEIAGKCVPGIRLRLHHKRYTPRGEFLMHGTDQVAAFYLDSRHRPPAARRGKPWRQLQMTLHVLDLPKSQRNPGSKEVSKTGS